MTDSNGPEVKRVGTPDKGSAPQNPGIQHPPEPPTPPPGDPGKAKVGMGAGPVKLPDSRTINGVPCHRHEGGPSMREWHPVNRRHRDAKGNDITDKVHAENGATPSARELGASEQTAATGMGLERDPGMGPGASAPMGGGAQAPSSFAAIGQLLGGGGDGSGILTALSGTVGNLMKAVLTGDGASAVAIMGNAVNDSLGKAATRASAVYDRYGVRPGADPGKVGGTVKGRMFERDRDAHLQGMGQGLGDVAAAVGDGDVATMSHEDLVGSYNALHNMAYGEKTMDLGGERVTLADYVNAYANGDARVSRSDGLAATERLAFVNGTLTGMERQAKVNERAIRAKAVAARREDADRIRQARIDEALARRAEKEAKDAARFAAEEEARRMDAEYQATATGGQKLLGDYSRDYRKVKFDDNGMPVHYTASLGKLGVDSATKAMEIASRAAGVDIDMAELIDQFIRAPNASTFESMAKLDEFSKRYYTEVKAGLERRMSDPADRERTLADFNSYMNLARSIVLEKNHSDLNRRFIRAGLSVSQLQGLSRAYSAAIRNFDSRTYVKDSVGKVTVSSFEEYNRTHDAMDAEHSDAMRAYAEEVDKATALLYALKETKRNTTGDTYSGRMAEAIHDSRELKKNGGGGWSVPEYTPSQPRSPVPEPRNEVPDPGYTKKESEALDREAGKRSRETNDRFEKARAILEGGGKKPKFADGELEAFARTSDDPRVMAWYKALMAKRGGKMALKPDDPA